MKAIETEYKNQISHDIPDLWSRIEAGVDEYERNKAADNSEPVMSVDLNKTDFEIDKEKVTNIEEAAERKRETDSSFNRRKVITMIGRIVAAVACIGLAATVVFNFGRTKNGAAMTENATSSAPADACADEAPMYVEESEAAYEEDDYSFDMEQSFKSPEKAEETNREETMAESEGDEIAILSNEISCNMEEAAAIIQELKKYEVGSIKIAVAFPVENALGYYDWIDGDNTRVLWINDEYERNYFIFLEYIDDNLELRMITEDDIDGNIIYQAE